MVVAIHQPNFLPWCGYFAKLKAADVFVLLDNVPISKGSYTPRCQIRNGQGTQWLSVPVSFRHGDLISSVRFVNGRWADKHLKTLAQVYGRHPFFNEIMGLLEPAYKEPGDLLSEFNIRLICSISQYLGLPGEIVRGSHIAPSGEGDDRLIEIVRILGGDTYLSGKGGQNYQDPAKFAAADIQLVVRSYKPIPYSQGPEDFASGLSIADCLFNLGKEAVQLLEYVD